MRVKMGGKAKKKQQLHKLPKEIKITTRWKESS